MITNPEDNSQQFLYNVRDFSVPLDTYMNFCSRWFSYWHTIISFNKDVFRYCQTEPKSVLGSLKELVNNR